MRNSIYSMVIAASICSAASVSAESLGGQDRPLHWVKSETALNSEANLGGQDRNVGTASVYMNAPGEYVANSGQDRNVNTIPTGSDPAVCQNMTSDYSRVPADKPGLC